MQVIEVLNEVWASISWATLAINSFLFWGVYELVLLRKTRRLIIKSDNWLDIKEHPIPDSYDELIEDKNVIITDGNKVRVAYRIEYSKKGIPLLSSYEKAPITHWMLMPSPPREAE